MGDPKFTKGPWMLSEPMPNALGPVTKDGFFAIDGANWMSMLLVTRPLEGDDTEARANAALCIGAPRLYEAAENLLIAIGMGWDLDGCIEEMRAALSAAGGREG